MTKNFWSLKILCLILCFVFLQKSYAQFSPLGGMVLDDSDFSPGGDIFSDFEEDLESGQVLEDERFYNHSRFYAVQLTLGHTTYTGNRGAVYNDRFPSLGLSLMYFLTFKVGFGIGVAYSQHYFVVNEKVVAFDLEGGPGLIEVNMFRSFVFMRYYIDTYNLGTAFTFSNPYITGRLEFWDKTNKFRDIEQPSQSASAIGSSFGFGFDFPIEIKSNYVNVEFLYHKINFDDTYTQAFRSTANENGGIKDLSGDVLSLFAGFVLNW